MRLAAYLRVSRVGGRAGDSFISVPEQVDKITSYCEQRGHVIVGQWEDLDQTGGRMERPHFEEMMRVVERGEADGVIVSKLDRFARTTSGAYVAIARLDAVGAQLIAIDNQIDTAGPWGKVQRALMLSFAELERDRIKANWATAREYAVARGVHISTRVPTGYSKNEDTKRMEPNKDAPAIQEAFRLRASGATNGQIAAMLSSKGVIGAHKSAGWSPAAVQRLLTNRVYLGEARSGTFTNPTAHEPLITAAEYYAAAANRGLRPVRSPDGFLLSGLVRCAGCRYRMTGTRGTNKGKPSWTYRCKKDHPAGTCAQPATIMSHILDEYITERFHEAIQPGGLVFEAHSPTPDLEAAGKRLQEAEAELAAYLTSSAISAGDAAFEAGLTVRIAARDDADAALRAARAEIGPTFDPVTGAEVWEKAGTSHRREILAAAIDAIYVRKRSVAGRDLDARVHIYWRGTGPQDVPRTGKPAEAIRALTWPS